MNRAELSRHVAADLGLPIQTTDRLVQAVFRGIVRGTVADGSCTISNFGTFSVRRRHGRRIRSPFAKGQDAEITEGRRVGFRAGKGFREAVDRPPEALAETA